MKLPTGYSQWQKTVIAVAVIAVLQLATTLVAFQVTVYFMKSCSSDGALAWQCSGTVDPTYWVLGAVAIVPPLVAKFLLRRLHISWKRMVAIHLIVLVILFSLAYYADSASNCGCGEA